MDANTGYTLRRFAEELEPSVKSSENEKLRELLDAINAILNEEFDNKALERIKIMKELSNKELESIESDNAIASRDEVDPDDEIPPNVLM